MKEPLLVKLTGYFPKIRMSCLRNLLILSMSILNKETVCLNKLKGSVGIITGKPNVKPASHYKRLIRLFDNYAFSRLWIELLRFGFQLFRLKTDYLLLDGTSWKRGQKWYHFMTLCMVYRQVAIPIYWIDLNKHGTSNYKERKKLINKAKRYFNLSGKTLLADREYIGKDWFKYLLINEISFVIRLKKKFYRTAIDRAPGKTFEQLERKVLASKLPYKAVKKTFELEGMTLQIVIIKNTKPNAKEKLLYLITNIDRPAPSIAAMYPIRWKIEHCFKHLKSNGFHLEAINLRGLARTKLLMAVVVFAYCLSIHEGLKSYKKVAVKTYKNGSVYKELSIFRFGLDRINDILWTLEDFCEYLLLELEIALGRYKSPFSINV